MDSHNLIDVVMQKCFAGLAHSPQPTSSSSSAPSSLQAWAARRIPDWPVSLYGFQPGFWRRQIKTIVVFAILIPGVHAMSLRMESQEPRNDRATALDSYWTGRIVLQEIEQGLQSAVPASVKTSAGPDAIPHSEISFRLGNGTRISYFENHGTLVRTVNGVEEVILSDLSSAAFLLPSKKRKAARIELNVWRIHPETQDQDLEELARDVVIVQNPVRGKARASRGPR